MNESMFEMDRKIQELEHAMTANDEYTQKVEALNAELLAACKQALLDKEQTELHSETRDMLWAAITKAEGRE